MGIFYIRHAVYFANHRIDCIRQRRATIRPFLLIKHRQLAIYYIYKSTVMS